MRKEILIAVLMTALILAMSPVLGAKITKFNNETAETVDQVSYLVLGKDLSGNVTVQFNNNSNSYGYRLTTTAHKLVITFTANLSNQTGNFSYTATGDTVNLTVTRYPTNITFNYTNAIWTAKNVNITVVNLTFNYSSGYVSSQGIDTGTVMTDSAVLAYVSNASATDYTTSTTPEKITYIVFDPATVYKYSSYFTTTDDNVTVYVTDTTSAIDLNLSKASVNKLSISYKLERYNYSNTKVPINKAYFNVYLNKTYFTSIVPVAGTNSTDVGLSESNGYIKAVFLDTKVAYNSTFLLTAYAWDTNGTLEDGYKFMYDLDPIGGPKVTSTHTKNVTITLPAALVAPPTAMYWWSYEYYGISVLAWIGIIVVISIVALLIYRYSKGMPLIPRSLSGQASIIGMFAFLAILSQLTEWFNSTWTWAQENYVFIGIVIAAVLITLLVVMWHYGTTRR